MTKGRQPPEKQIDHAAAFIDRLGSAAAAVFNPGVKWETYAEVQREQYRGVARAVLDAITIQRRGLKGQFEVGSGYSSQRLEPYVEIMVSFSPVQCTSAKARELGLLLLECAEAAESDALLAVFGREQLDLDPVGVAKLLDLFRRQRERKLGGKVESA